MRKILSLVLVLAMILSSFPAFAAVDYTAVGNELKELGVIKGDNSGNLLADEVLTREQAMVVLARMNGLEEEAASETLLPSFTDVTAGNYYTPFIAFAEKKGWTNGIGGGLFGYGQELRAAEFHTLMVRVLGYEVATLEEGIAKAVELGLAKDSNVTDQYAPVLRGEVFIIMKNTLWTVPVGETLALVYVLKLTEVPAPAKLEVHHVDASNRKTMTVVFNQPVDEDTITATTVKLVQGTTNRVAERLLSEDGKTLVIVYNTTVAQSTELKLTIDGVVSAADATKIEDYVVTKLVNDVTVPTILGVTALNAKQIEVQFSEPMDMTAYSSEAFQVLNNVKIGDLAVIAKTTQNFLNNTVVFELTSILDAKEHTIKIEDMIDYATYKAVTFTGTIVVIEDKAAPVLVNAVVKNVTTIEVEFDEAVFTNGEFWVGGNPATATPLANSNNKKFSLALGTALDLAATVEIKLEYKGQKDVVGNEVKDKVTYTFKVADDTAIPTVAIAVAAGNKITLTFDKSMNTQLGTVQVLKSNKAAHSALLNVSGLTFKANTNNTVIELTAAQLGLDNVDPGTYFVNIKNMKDATVRANLLPEVTFEFTALDTKKPVVTSSYTVAAGTATGDNAGKDDTITFYFSEAMDVETLKNLSNYVLEGGSALSAITGVSFKSAAADGKSVTITYPDARLFVAQTFTVYALKDVAGNMVITATGINKNSAVDLLSATAKLTANNTVVVTFNTPIASADPSFLKVQKLYAVAPLWRDEAIPVSATVGTGAKANEVTFVLNKSIGTDPTDYRLVFNNFTTITNIYGNKFTGVLTNDVLVAGGTITDVVKPVLVSVTQAKTGDPLVNDPNKFVLKFSENVTVDTLANLANDLVIRYPDSTLVAYPSGYTLSNIEVTPSTDLVVTLLPNAKLTDGTNAITVQLAAERYLKDVVTPANFVAPFAAQSVNVTVALNAANVAVLAYEAGPLTSTAQVTTAEGLKAAADTAVAALAAGADKTALELRITNRAAAIATVKANFAAAEVAVAAYEAGTLLTIAQVATAEGLKAAADTANGLTPAGVTRTALEARVTARAAVILVERNKVTALTTAVTAAQAQHGAAVEGTDPGQYPAPAKADYLTAINTANTVATTPASLITAVVTATADLAAATVAFEALEVQ